jgi:capsule polysaccharide export protein KpsE/RkpR
MISLLLPKIYESTATVLPQLESNDAGSMAALLSLTGAGGAAQSLGISLPGAPATPTDIFIAILKSRTMADAAVKQFNLMDVYQSRTPEDARRDLQAATQISLTKEKVIKVTVEATSPQLAAELANFYVNNLDRLNRTLTISKATHNRRFIEQRLSETQVGLVKAEEELRDFQTKNKTVAVEAQSKAMIEAAAHVQAQIAAHEVQLEAMSSYLSSDNPQLVPIRTTLQELRKQLYMMESGKGGKGMLPGDRLHPAMITVPALALDYGRLMRELKVQESLYALLTSQYEQAKLAEARDTPTVQVLDPAVPPERKIRPVIRKNVLISGLLSLLFSVFCTFSWEAIVRWKTRPAVPVPSVS